MSLEVQESIIKYIQKNISKYSSVRIDWFGGEPLLKIGVIENISKKVIDICKKSRKNYISSITTNGYFLSQDVIKKLIELKVMFYSITLDGTKKLHDDLRYLKGKQPTYDIIMDNLLFIKNNVKDKKIRVVIRTNITSKIYSKLSEYYSLYNELF